MAKVSEAQADLEQVMQEAQAKSNGLSSVQEEFQELKDQMGSIGGTADIDGKKYLIVFVIFCVYFGMFIAFHVHY